MTDEQLTSKIRRIYQALSVTNSVDWQNIEALGVDSEGRIGWSIDFNQDRPNEELLNIVHSLIGNIASVKDHLKLFCDSRGKSFEGDTLINTNQDVALIHDLWNADKHGKLTKSRSGKFPSLSDVSQVLSLTSGTTPGSGASFMMSMDGKPVVNVSGGGKAELKIVGQIMDRHGIFIGALEDILERAIAAWESVLADAGVPVAVVR